MAGLGKVELFYKACIIVPKGITRIRAG